jgi:hypothetical protein
MPELKMKEGYGTWKGWRLIEATENRREHSLVPIESAAERQRLQTRRIFSEALSLLLLGGLAALFVYSFCLQYCICFGSSA